MKSLIKKRSILFFLCLSLVLLTSTLSGCQESEPVKTVKSELNLIQNLDENTIRNLISYEDMVHSRSGSVDIGPDTTEAVQLFFRNFHYRILSSSTTEEQATVNVEIENIDAKALAKDLCLELIADSVLPESKEDTSVARNSYFTLLRDVLSSGNYDQVKTVAHFSLTKKDGHWSIQSSETLEDELVGGFISCLHDPYLVTPEEIITKVLEMFKEETPENWVSSLGMNDIFLTYSTLYDKVDLALATQISKCFSYRIQKVTVKGNKATSLIDITSLDMESILDTYLERLLDYASTTEAVRATDTELADKTASLLMECLNTNTKTCTKTIEIYFINNGVTWEMQLNGDFTDALLGNMTEAIERFQSEALPAS